MTESNTLTEYLNIFSYNFRRLRYHHKQTQEFISLSVGITEPTINDFEQGKRVTLTTVALISDHFKVRLSDFYKDKEYNQEILPLLKLSFVGVDLIPDELRVSFLNYFLGTEIVSQSDFKRWVNYLEYRRSIFLVQRGGILNKFSRLGVGEKFHYDGRHHAFLFDLVSNTNNGVYLLSNKSGTHNCTRIC